eukprot:TRINITY_DN4544_c0_g1_i1.p2 TRINITY_DN4544_c0_g1~~TRINITY_DN4544_c0_g1_i1.p2  ORF type:complete len:193 (+),score=43.80 TRINITY_DN4544_c0_g1_i1:46-624(+)
MERQRVIDESGFLADNFRVLDLDANVLQRLDDRRKKFLDSVEVFKTVAQTHIRGQENTSRLSLADAFAIGFMSASNKISSKADLSDLLKNVHLVNESTEKGLKLTEKYYILSEMLVDRKLKVRPYVEKVLKDGGGNLERVDPKKEKKLNDEAIKKSWKRRRRKLEERVKKKDEEIVNQQECSNAWEHLHLRG